MLFKRNRQSRRLTLAGLAFALAAFLTMVAALNTGDNLLYVVFSVLVGFLAASWPLSGAMLRGLKVTRRSPGAVHCEETCGVTVFIENRKRLLPSFALRIARADNPRESEGFVPVLPRRSLAEVRVSTRFERRGVYPLPPFSIVSRFPFGLVQCRVRFSDGQEVVVYPRVRAIRTFRLEAFASGGALPRTARGNGDEFFSLREYVVGDDIRRIAWRASARREDLLVRELELTQTRTVVFLFDSRWKVDVPDFPERFEEAVELAASLAVLLLNRQFTVGLTGPTMRVSPGEGHVHARRILDALARVQPTDDEGWGWVDAGEEAVGAAKVLVSPDPDAWGRSMAPGLGRTVDPREVVRA